MKTSSSSIPSKIHRRWQAAEFGMFCHFGINTFYGKEWSDGTLDPGGFIPHKLDASQWVDAAVRAGMKYLVFTAKHHDGFCLWPTATTKYSVASSPWRGGKGDVVQEVAKACREAGIGLGLYLSPWDRNAACYSDGAAYDAFYCRQLEELCTRYGELFEIWLDGAGSEGREYNWHRIMAVIDRHQPSAAIFNMGRPHIRWVGNEDGLASDPNYYEVREPLRISAFESSGREARNVLARYLPPECDVPIRGNWFWQGDDIDTLKSCEHLLGIYYRSVGLGANLLLNLPPDRNGLLDGFDTSRLDEVASELKRRFARPMPGSIIPGQKGCELIWGEDIEFDHLVLKEDYSRGQRIDGYQVMSEDGGRVIAEGITIGHQRILVFPRCSARRLQIFWNGVGAGLEGGDAYLTGCETVPALGSNFDYSKWSDKADQGAAKEAFPV